MDDQRQEPAHWQAEDARGWIAVPTEQDDKYSRGVLGMVTGSARYPGAAVLGAEAAARTGVGMIRYLGAQQAAQEVLRRRPEIVSAPGRVQAWLDRIRDGKETFLTPTMFRGQWAARAAFSNWRTAEADVRRAFEAVLAAAATA